MNKTIYLAGGCFWGTAHLFSLVPGVVSATAGYANSIVENPVSYTHLTLPTIGG